MAVFKGNTSGGQKIAEAQSAEDAPFLSASFWKPKTKLYCVVLSTHKSGNGPYISVRLTKPSTVEIDGKAFAAVRIGNLAGIVMARVEALNGAKTKYFCVGDKLYLECTGITPPEKEGHSPSPNFYIEVDREEEAAA
jgi:hypothetical protein